MRSYWKSSPVLDGSIFSSFNWIFVNNLTNLTLPVPPWPFFPDLPLGKYVVCRYSERCACRFFCNNLKKKKNLNRKLTRYRRVGISSLFGFGLSVCWSPPSRDLLRRWLAESLSLERWCRTTDCSNGSLSNLVKTASSIFKHKIKRQLKNLDQVIL